MLCFWRNNTKKQKKLWKCWKGKGRMAGGITLSECNHDGDWLNRSLMNSRSSTQAQRSIGEVMLDIFQFIWQSFYLLCTYIPWKLKVCESTKEQLLCTERKWKKWTSTTTGCVEQTSMEESLKKWWQSTRKTKTLSHLIYSCRWAFFIGLRYRLMKTF